MACDHEGMSLKAIQELSHLQATSERNTHTLTRASYFFLKYIFIKCLLWSSYWTFETCPGIRMLYFEIYHGHCALGRCCEIQNPQVDFYFNSLFFSLTCHTISIFDLPQLCKSWIIFLMANYKIHTTLYLLKGTFWLSSLFGLSCRVYCPTLPPHGLWSARLLCSWDSPGKNTGVGCHFLL